MLSLIRTDANLVDEALRGGGSATEALVLRYQKRAYAVARANLASWTEPSDAVQEAFFQALRDLRSLRERERFGPWFLSIVRNVARRQAGRERPAVSLGQLSPESLPERTQGDSLEWRDFRDQLWQEVRRLPDGVREAVFIYYHEGESVRSVARALGTTTAAAKKRLQKGRELLRESLWRKLGDQIREMLPSAREWRAKGRQATLLLLAALPARGAIEAAVATSSAAPVLASKVFSSTPAMLGVFAMSKKALSLAFLFLCLSAASFWAGRSTRNAGGAAPASGDRSKDGVSRVSFLDLKDLHEKTARRLAEAEAHGRRLEDDLAALKRVPAPESKPAAAEVPSVSLPVSGINWTEFSSLVAKNLDVISPLNPPTPRSKADQDRFREIFGELLKLGARAKSVTPQPIFHEGIFNELTSALFKESLELTGEQSAKLQEATRAIFETLPEDAAEKPPLARYSLRREMARQILQSVEGFLGEDQLERWGAVEEFADYVFSFGEKALFGIDGNNLLPNLRWRNGLDEGQNQALMPAVAGYEAEARSVLERFGRSEGDIKNLSTEDRRKLDGEFLELQRRFEAQLLRHLSEEQKVKYQESAPMIIQFDFGNSTAMWGDPSFF